MQSGEPYSLKRFPYVREIMDSLAKFNWIKKGAQTGLTEAAITIAVFTSIRHGRDVIYYFPTKAKMTEFSCSRVDDAILLSPFVKARCSMRNRDLKRFGAAGREVRSVGAETVIHPAVAWAARDRRWALRERALLMGVLNVTPDSFSDGGRFLDADAAVARGMQMVEEGADLIDVGGESSRPGAEPVSADEEIRRTEPVVQALAEAGAAVSIDTTKAAVARVALAAGAVAVNDISAGRLDEGLPAVAAEFGAGYVAMHMRGTPQTMQIDPRYEDVVAEVVSFLEERAEALERTGVRRESIALDPGIGFGKTSGHNLTLLAHIAFRHADHVALANRSGCCPRCRRDHPPLLSQGYRGPHQSRREPRDCG